MIYINDKKMCCGCGACAQACPKQCITMVRDEEGFSYPSVDYKQCVECGLCEKVCPILNSQKKQETVKKIYVAFAKDEPMRLQSSSGGIFSLCAEEILQAGGTVFGASFDKNMQVEHIGVNCLETLSLLRGSKYSQSNIKDTYKETKELLENSTKVLYIGTACQIAGLKKYLRKEYDNLFTVDVLCHGVPSPRVWELYLKELKQKYDSQVESVSFRNKKTGWKSYSVDINMNNGLKYCNIHREDKYMKLFLKDICLRPSCHNCQFKALERPSDITLGDCWGVQNYMPEMDDDKGTSVVLIHSDKGQLLFDAIREQMVCKEAEVDKALPPTADSRKSVMPHKNREKFFKMLNAGAGFDKLVKLVQEPFLTRFKRKVKRMKKM